MLQLVAGEVGGEHGATIFHWFQTLKDSMSWDDLLVLYGRTVAQFRREWGIRLL